MLATLVDDPFDDKTWVFETKWDGFRLITGKGGHAVRLWSRNGIDVTTRYAVLLRAPTQGPHLVCEFRNVRVDRHNFGSYRRSWKSSFVLLP
jgi:ATP-dependent DNA ligase